VNYGQQFEREGDTIVFVLPSPSGATRGAWKEEHWAQL